MPRVANLILLLVAAVVPIAGAEVLLRAVAPLSLDEEVEFTQTLPGVKETVVYERDRLGLRRPDRDTWEEDGTLRILCVGGSTAEQVPQSFPDTWCGSLASTLEQTLEAQGERTAVRAAIFGRGGFRAVDVLDWVSRNLDEVQPDLVVALLGVNDLVWNGGSSYQYEGLERAVEASRERWAPDLSLAGRCRQVSQLCRRLAVVRNQLRQRASSADGGNVEWHSDSLPSLRESYRRLPVVETLERDPDPIVEFEEAVAALTGLATAGSTQLLLLGQPVLWRAGLSPEEEAALWFTPATPSGPVRLDPAALALEMDRYNRVQEAIAEKFGVTYLDLGSRIPRSLDYYFDDCHFTDLGSRAVAMEVAPVAAELLGIGVPRSPGG